LGADGVCVECPPADAYYHYYDHSDGDNVTISGCDKRCSRHGRYDRCVGPISGTRPTQFSISIEPSPPSGSPDATITQILDESVCMYRINTDVFSINVNLCTDRTTPAPNDLFYKTCCKAPAER